MHWALSLLFNFLWRGVDPSSMLVSELQMYIMTGWSYWLLGAAHSLMMRDSVPIGVQIMALTFHRFNCACLEFNFTYLLQCRLSLLETGLGMKMGVGRVRRIRRVFLILQLSLDVVRGYLQTSSQLAVDWSSAIYHLVAGSGVAWLVRKPGSRGQNVSGSMFHSSMCHHDSRQGLVHPLRVLAGF